MVNFCSKRQTQRYGCITAFAEYFARWETEWPLRERRQRAHERVHVKVRHVLGVAVKGPREKPRPRQFCLRGRVI